MKHVFIFDPKSFREQPWKMDNALDAIGQYFCNNKNPDFSVLISRYRRHAIFLIQKEIEEAGEGNALRVYAAGGNDILYDCLNGIAGLSGVELAFMPFNASNDFYKFFGGVQKETFRDISSLAGAPAARMDMIAAGSSYALNTCFVGLPSVVKNKFSKQITFQRYKITIDGNDYSGNYSLINIANGPYYAGRKTAAAHALPDDGLLDVALITSAGPLKTLRSIRMYYNGKRPGNCILLQAKKISVQSDDPMWLQIDGEFSRNNNITFEVGAVNIVTA